MGDEGRLQKHYSAFDLFLKKSKKDFDAKVGGDLEDNAKLEDFQMLQILGTGSFGKVVLCKSKLRSGTFFAMKIMEKSSIVKTKQVAHTVSEIRFLEALRFPFLVHLSYFFRNNVYIFIVMPFISGGEMFFHLRSSKKFDETMAKFYAAQVILCFEYIHYMGIVYRDLKPENIMIDLEGYLKVTDLGFCKKIDSQRTYTLCGTPEYLAPEIILSQGYNKSVDWWSLGILIYEMAAGYPPFNARDHMKLYEKIVSGKFICPGHFSKALKDLVCNMVQVDRTKRYGILKGGSKDVKGHEWFKSVDFEQIFNRKVKPSFKPTLSKEGETKYFDNYGPIHLRTASICEFRDEFKDLTIIP